MAGATDSTSVTASAPPGAAFARKRKWRRRRRILGAIVRWTTAIVALVIVAAVAGLSQTREGQDLVLRTALDRVRGSLAGELVIGGIRTSTLLAGATLVDVRLDAADGRPLLRADSVVVRYSLPALLAGAPPIRSTVLWGADFEISRYTADQVLNVERVLATGRADSAGASTARTITLRRLAIRDGSVRVLTPASAGSRRVRSAPDGSPLREIAFEDLDMDLEDLLLRVGGPVELDARLASLNSSAYLVEEPLMLREVFGDVTFGADGIRIRNAAFRLPSTLLRGGLTLGPARPGESWTLRGALSADGWGDLSDLAWIDPRVPEGRFRGAATLRIPDALEVDLEEVQIELEASDLVADGWMRFGDELSMRALRVRASPLAIYRLEPWLGVDFPLDGWLSGEATFSGTVSDLSASGRLTLVPTGFGGAPTTAEFAGTIHRGANPGATGFEVRLDPFNYAVLRAYWPDGPWVGGGAGRVELDGRAREGVAVFADFTHETAPDEPSRVLAYGVIRRGEDGAWVSDLRGELAPLSMSVLSQLVPGTPLSGRLSGPVHATGRLDGLQLGGELITEAGGISFGGEIDVFDPASAYRLELDAEDFLLSSLTAKVPSPSSWTGHLEVHGSGVTLETLRATAMLSARDSRVGLVRVDTVAAGLRLENGVLITDTLRARAAGIEVDGRGRFGLAPGTWGSSRLAFRAETLVGLRPLLMGVGDSVLVRDGLNDLDREFLRASGIEPDTLPSAVDVRMAGAVRGAANLSGEIRAFDLGLLVDVVGGQYRENQVDSARIALTATGLPTLSGSWGLGAGAVGIVWNGRDFQQGGFEAEMVRRAGDGRIELVRSVDEAYRGAGSFRFDSLGGEVGLTEGQIQVREDVWNLTRPSRIAWSGTSLEVDSLDVHREGTDPMSLHADGVLTRGGDSDFRMSVDGLHVDRLLHILQREDLEAGGHIELDVAVSGPSEAPLINGTFRVDGPRYGAMQLTRLDGSLDYADRLVEFRLTGWDGVRDAIDAYGTIPLDLSLAVVADRVPTRAMDVRLSADSLDAAIALSYLTTLQQVVGVVSGDVHVGGTPAEPQPEGVVTLEGGAWTIEAIGVRHTGVDGSLTLNPDRTVDVALTARAPGASTVNGRVVLVPFRNPRLDLTFAFRRFQAVARPDVEALISGEFVLGGTYNRPLAEGTLSVDESTIYVDEFRRAASIVDLTDAMLLERELGVDTTALVAQPLIAGLRNPFFDNLRVDIDLSVPRNTWLRSIDTNVEMGGELLVTYDRREGDLVLIGELEAVRGSHLVLGRTFEVESGTVSFIGRPGLNPDLDIQASTRIFRRQDENLQVDAHVGGTLIQPVVTLSTEEAGTSEADIVSYLVFGQASGDLSSTRSAMFSRLAEEGAFSGGVSFLSGQFANQFGTVLAQETGLLDYVSVQLGSRADRFYGRSEVEAGWYLGRRMFAVVVLRPTVGGADVSRFGGARLELQLNEGLSGEVFLEDRFLRSGAGFTLPELLDDPMVLGIFFFRDWGY